MAENSNYETELEDYEISNDELAEKTAKRKRKKKVLDTLLVVPKVTTKVATNIVEAALNYHDFARTGERHFLSLVDRLERFAKAFGKNSFLGASILKWVQKEREKEAVEKKIEEYRIDYLAKQQIAKSNPKLSNQIGVKDVSFGR